MIGLLVRSDLRRRWRSWLAVVALVGVIGGVSLAALAGWQRTDTAMERFYEHYRPANGYTEGQFEEADLEAIDGVEVVMGGDYFLLAPVDAEGKPHPEHLGQVSPFSNDSPENMQSVARPIVVDGELPDPTDETQVAIDEEMADLYDLQAGDTLTMQAYGMDQSDELFGAIGSLLPTGDTFDFTVSAIIRAPEDVVPHQSVPEVVYLGNAAVLLGPAFDEAHRRVDVPSLGAMFSEPGPAGVTGLELRIDPSAETKAAVKDAIRSLDPDALVDFSGSDAAAATDQASRSITLQANLLLALGAVVLVGGLVLITQALRRQLEADRATQRSMSSLGATRSSAVRVAVVKGGIVAAASAVLAVVVAIALSPLAPVGHARRAEIDPGIDVDLRILLPGALLLGLFVVGFTAVSAWRTRSAEARARRAARTAVGLSDRAAHAGMPPSVVAGVRAASLGAGKTTVLATVFIAAIGIVGALGFAASEQRLATDSDLWGWTFDAAVGDGTDPAVLEHAEAALADNPMIESYAARITLDGVTLAHDGAGVEVDAAAIQPIEGTIEPRMLRGDAPSADDEIALGGATARKLGVDIGDEVNLDAGGEPRDFTVTGLAVMNLAYDAERMGEGVLLAPAGVDALGAEPEPPIMLVDYAEGVDPDVAYAALQDSFGYTVLRPTHGVDVDQLHEVRHLPLWFSVFLAVVAAATLAFVLIITIRQRRRDLALLRTLGFERRQLRSTVLAQSLMLVVPGTVLGIVGGVVVGRLAWSATAQGMGTPEVQVAPVLAIVAVLVVAILLAVGVAVVPAQLAARTHPARVLRSE